MPASKLDQEDVDEKEERFEVRLPRSLKRKAEEKAEKRGWTLASIVRSLLELWVDEDVVAPEDVGKAAKRAKRKKKQSS